MNKPPSKLPVHRNKPVGRSITASDVASMVKSAEARKAPAEVAPRSTLTPKRRPVRRPG